MSAPETAVLEVRACLGAGGFGEVYLADRLAPGGLRSEVAVKVLRAGLDPRSQAVQRLVDEARLLAWLHHPHLLRVYELGMLEGQVALIAEYIDGADLDTCRTQTDPDRALPLGAACEALARVTDALEAAWTRPGPTGAQLQLLHRDLKPANIRIGRHGEVKLLDFGIAKAAGLERSARTRADAVIGSFPYLAPERFDLTHAEGLAADVFSLGCTLYEATTGRLLLDLPVQQLFRLAMDEGAHRLRIATALRELEPEPLRELLAELLDYAPEQRPSMSVLGRRLDDLADTLGGPRLTRWCRDHAWPDPTTQTGALTGRTLRLEPLSVATLGAPPVAPTFESDAPTAEPSRSTGTHAEPSRHPAVESQTESSLGAIDSHAQGSAQAALAAPRSRVRTVAALITVVGVSSLFAGASTALLVGALGLRLYTQPTPLPNPAPPPVTTPHPEEVPAAPPAQPRGAPEPLAPAPAVVAIACGDPIALEPPALLGRLPPAQRDCLAAAIRDTTRPQTERDRLGRVLLVDAKAQCDAGACAAYEREQPAFFTFVSRSDADLMLGWADHLYQHDGAGDDIRTWAERALERREQWSGAARVSQELRAHEINSRTAYRQWEASPRDESLRLSARNAAADWAEVLSGFAKNPEPALALCRSAAGSDGPCVARVETTVARADLRFTSSPIGVELWIDGDRVGTTPVDYPLDHGAHVVEMRQGDQIDSRRIDVDGTSEVGWHWVASTAAWEGRF